MSAVATNYRYFRLLKGRHYDEQNRLYVAKDDSKNIVRTEGEDLAAIWKNKFEEITERMALMKQKLEEDTQEVAKSLGEDVTRKFPSAKKAGFIVFRNADKLHVIVDPKQPGQPLNRKPLSKESVDKFIELQTA